VLSRRRKTLRRGPSASLIEIPIGLWTSLADFSPFFFLPPPPFRNCLRTRRDFFLSGRLRRGTTAYRRFPNPPPSVPSGKIYGLRPGAFARTTKDDEKEGGREGDEAGGKGSLFFPPPSNQEVERSSQRRTRLPSHPYAQKNRREGQERALTPFTLIHLFEVSLTSGGEHNEETVRFSPGKKIIA